MPEVEQMVSMQQLDGKICEMFPLLKIGCAQLQLIIILEGVCYLIVKLTLTSLLQVE
jgi:hypothetical protein